MLVLSFLRHHLLPKLSNNNFFFFPPSGHRPSPSLPSHLPLPLLVPFISPSISCTSCTIDVPAWLKSLRLHKYAALFSQMTYEEMMALTECQLEAQVHAWGAPSMRQGLEVQPRTDLGLRNRPYPPSSLSRSRSAGRCAVVSELASYLDSTMEEKDQQVVTGQGKGEEVRKRQSQPSMP